MKKNKVPIIAFRRKRSGQTNYRRRMKLLLSGKPRLVVRKSLKNIHAQIVEFAPSGDKILVSVNSRELAKMGWDYSRSNIPAAYLVGLLLGKKAKEKKIEQAILDLGLQQTMGGTRLYAVVAGAVDAGVDIPHSQEALPNAERLNGSHIASFATSEEKPQTQFSKSNPKEISKKVEEIKKKIIGA